MAAELESLLMRFAAAHALHPLVPEADGRVTIELDDRLRIAIFQSGYWIFLEGIPAQLPMDEPRASERLQRVLHGALAEMERAEEVFALAPEGRDLLLFRRLPAPGLTSDAFEQALAGFANRLEFWTRVLSERPPAAAPAPALPLYIIRP